MGENDQEKSASVSKANTPEEIGEFWDNHIRNRPKET